MSDFELQAFKREASLVQYAIDRHGYVRDARESSVHSVVLRQPANDDKIVVRQDPKDGHWTYFSVRDERDSGSIVDFVQRRRTCSLGDARNELRQWLGRPRPTPDPASLPPAPARALKSTAETFERARPVANSLYLNARGIRPDTLTDARFAGTWRVDARNNVLFAHTNDRGEITGCEAKNRAFTGFSPGGTKSAWQSATLPTDRALIVTESALDALSYHQIHRDLRATSRFLSTAGSLGSMQAELLDRLLAHPHRPPLAVVAATDNDAAGHKLAETLERLAKRHNLPYERHAPTMGKDWNDALKHIERAFIAALPEAVRRLGKSIDRPR